MSGGQINGPGASPVNQQLPDTKALDKADETEIIRLKNGKFKVGTSQGSVFNRTVRKVFMPKTYQKEAARATQSQQAAAVDAVEQATGKRIPDVSLKNRQITVARFRHLLNPPPPQVPESVSAVLSQPGAKPKDVFNALQEASKGLHEGKQYKHEDLAGGGRFANIRVPHRNVVHVRVASSNGSGETENKPFHANTVGKNYIATQAPLGSGQSPGLMFQMLYNENTGTVVNLTNLADAAKGNITYQYWPDKGHTQQHGDLLVQTSDIEKQNGFDVITLKVGKEGIYGNDLNSDTAREIKIFHYHGWPDHGVPGNKDVSKFNHFMDTVEAQGEPNRTTVHCRAGVGRTGVFIALNQLKHEARDGTLDKSNLMTRAAEVVWSGREDRGEQFVQTEVQFKFIVSELEKELTRLESEPDGEPVSNSGEDINGNTSFHTSASGAPPANSEFQADAIISKLNAGGYATSDAVIADLRKVNDYNQMEKLVDQFTDWENRSTAEDQKDRFRELKDAAYDRLIRM